MKTKKGENKSHLFKRSTPECLLTPPLCFDRTKKLYFNLNQSLQFVSYLIPQTYRSHTCKNN